MIGTIFYPLSRVITAISLFFTTLFAGGGLATATGNAPPSLDPLPYANWVHQHWVWENTGNCDSAREFIKTYQKHEIPVGVMILDRPWEMSVESVIKPEKLHPAESRHPHDTTGSHIPDPSRYCCFYAEWEAHQRGETYEGLLHFFHSNGIKVCLWASCVVNTNAPNHWSQEGSDAKRSYFLNDGKVIRWWGGDGSFIDYSNPEAVAWWEASLGKMLDMGIDGWKLDGADPYVMLMGPAYGKSGLMGWKSYQKLQYEHYYNFTRSKGDTAVLARPTDDVIGWGLPLTFAPREINFSGWVGDQDSGFPGLRQALNQMFTSALFNYVSYGSDIGGFRSAPGGDPDPEDAFIRWAQLGAFCPIMENGGGGEHRPWIYDERRGDGKTYVTDIYRDFVKLHYKLIPYIQSQVMYSFERMQPTMRPTFGYYQYMLGDDIFVAPIVNEGNDRTIIFPAGEWIYMFDETKTYKAGVKTLDFPFEEFPAFIRKGAIIPMGPVSLKDTEDFTAVHVYPVNGTRQFGLYEDGKRGSTLAYSAANNALTLTATATDRPLLWRVYRGGEPVWEAKLNGQDLEKADSLAQLKTMASGYCYEEGEALWIVTADAKAGVEVVVK